MKTSKHTPIISSRFHIRCYPDTWWLSKKFTAITWFGTIHFNCSRAKLERWMDTDCMREIERHEHIHMLQAQSFRTRYLGFYLCYLYYWVRNTFRYKNIMQAYQEIPFEREAYANDYLYDYPVSRWRNYR